MFIKKGYVYLFNCSFYTVGPVLQPASARHPRLLCTKHFLQPLTCRYITAHRLLPAYYATTLSINSCGSVTFSFELFGHSAAEKWGEGDPAASSCLFLSGLTLRGCKYRRTVRCDSRVSAMLRW